MIEAGEFGFANQVARQDQVLPLRAINITIKFYDACVLIIVSRIEVGIDLVEVTIIDTEVAFKVIRDLMLDIRPNDIRFECMIVVFWIAEDDVVQVFNRTSIGPGRNTAIDEALMIGILIGQVEYSVFTVLISKCWVEAFSITIIEITMII